MKKNLILFILLLVIIAGGWYLMSKQKQEENRIENTDSIETEEKNNKNVISKITKIPQVIQNQIPENCRPFSLGLDKKMFLVSPNQETIVLYTTCGHEGGQSQIFDSISGDILWSPGYCYVSCVGNIDGYISNNTVLVRSYEYLNGGNRTPSYLDVYTIEGDFVRRVKEYSNTLVQTKINEELSTTNKKVFSVYFYQKGESILLENLEI